MKKLLFVLVLFATVSSDGKAQQTLAGTPKVSIEKTVLDFGKVIVKQSKTLNDEFGNIGTAELQLVSTTNTNPSEYTILGPQGPFLFDPGHSTIYSITFSPQHSDSCFEHVGRFIFTFDDGTDTTITFVGCDEPLNDVEQKIINASTISLGAIYPNPFISSTTIPFTLSQRGFVTLEVLDQLGKSVATLASGSYDAGTNEVKLNAENLPAATYFVRLRNSDKSIIKGIELLK